MVHRTINITMPIGDIRSASCRARWVSWLPRVGCSCVRRSVDRPCCNSQNTPGRIKTCCNACFGYKCGNLAWSGADGVIPTISCVIVIVYFCYMMARSLHEREDNSSSSTVRHNVSCNKKDVKTNVKSGRYLNFPNSGLCAVFVSTLFYSTNAIIVKMLNDLHPLQLTLARSGVQFILVLPLVSYKRKKEDILGKPGLRKFMWLRGLCGAAGMLCLYSAISFLRAADAVTLAYSRMMFIPFIARIVLREKISAWELVLAVLSLVGVVLIAEPTFIFPASASTAYVSPVGVMFGILAALFQGTSIVIVRKLGDTYPPLSVGYYSLCGAVISIVLLMSLQLFQYPCAQDLPLFFSLGFFGLAGQYLLTIGLQRERAGSVAVLLSLQLIVVNVLQVLFLGDVPSVLSIIGTSLILISSITLGVRKMRKTVKE